MEKMNRRQRRFLALGLLALAAFAIGESDVSKEDWLVSYILMAIAAVHIVLAVIIDRKLDIRFRRFLAVSEKKKYRIRLVH
jgi:hypothetical protein